MHQNGHLEQFTVEKSWLGCTNVTKHRPALMSHTNATGKEVMVLVSWLQTVDPSLERHLQTQGITPEWVEAKYKEECCTSLAYRHRLINTESMETTIPRFHIRIDAKC